MALEAVVFQQDPFSYGYCRDFHGMEGWDCYGGFGFEEDDERKLNCETFTEQVGSNGGYYYWDSSPPVSVANTSSPEVCAAAAGNGLLSSVEYPAAMDPQAAAPLTRRKRRRTKCSKNKEEIENQRMTHIEVERNRRRQMNDYLAVLRSMMPPSYAQRGDQASIVGGAINFVKELEQLSQFLEAHKLVKNLPYYNAKKTSTSSSSSLPFSNFFHFPQYSTSATRNHAASDKAAAEKCSAVADIEVAMVDDHANVKVLSRKRPKQLLKMITWFHAMSLTILHLNATTIDQMVLYSFSLKVEEECRLSTVKEIASSVHEMVAMIEQENQ
ncbi:PREDICTED: transcription factor bHLH96-like [Ipomoea nil]|uniref:transcription factor bHLH96-like n=1 Tax=Ipomoea nil TaxID=35883 RepID=UPI00090139E1|nr:PREDICTED: transcription factor bHLH96-like [Ipomoea nil]